MHYYPFEWFNLLVLDALDLLNVIYTTFYGKHSIFPY